MCFSSALIVGILIHLLHWISSLRQILLEKVEDADEIPISTSTSLLHVLNIIAFQVVIRLLRVRIFHPKSPFPASRSHVLFYAFFQSSNLPTCRGGPLGGVHSMDDLEYPRSVLLVHTSPTLLVATMSTPVFASDVSIYPNCECLGGLQHPSRQTALLQQFIPPTWRVSSTLFA